MSFLTIESTNNTEAFSFYKNTTFFNCLTQKPIKNKENNVKFDFTSPNKKFYISLLTGPHHFLINCLSSILKELENNKDAIFIFDTRNLKKIDDIFLNFLINHLNKKNINYHIINTINDNFILINNFYYLSNYDAGYLNYKYLDDLINNTVNSDSIASNKKIYLSRSNLSNRFNHEVLKNISNVNNITFKDDNRIYNESILEDFLLENGFEIINPENFQSLEHQINYMHSVNTIVSATSAGLTNVLFMKQKSNVIELITPLTIFKNLNIKNKNNFKLNKMPEIDVQVHFFWQHLSYMKKHYYFGMPNYTRNSHDIINMMKNNKSIINMIGGNN